MNESYNTNENVKVVLNARIDSREMSDLICKLAGEIADGTRDAMPEDYADLFTVEIVTRPSGSKYAVVDFS